MHSVTRAHEYTLVEPTVYAKASRGYTQAALVNERQGSLHTGLSLNEVAAGGMIATHLHSFEEGFYVLQGQAVVTVDERLVTVGPGDFGLLKVGVPHAWANTGRAPVRWLQMAAPQPKPAGKERDTFFPTHAHNSKELDPGREQGAVLLSGHFDASQIPPEDARPAGLAKGVFLKWMIDEGFGAIHHRLLFIEYQPGASIALHDHTFEESYFILEGEIQATLDGRVYRVTAGDVVWTGVGCVHAFANVSTSPVRWLETFSPQPPRENVFRFMAEWDRRAAALEG
ncbi:MAG: cupin domain-containing protein [Vicinamibacterales bacterium]